jgi:citrate lyase gamma subunit
MAKKKTVKIDTENVDINLEKDGTNIKLDVDTKNLDISYIKDEVNKEFKLDGKNIDIEISKTAEGVEVKVDSKGGLWKVIAKRVVKFILRRFKVGK